MKIDLFTFTYNDEALLPFFLEYYAPIVDTMTFYDSGSTDKTLQLIKPFGKVVQTGQKWWDWDDGHRIRQTAWKNSNADYIFWPDVDEIFYRPQLRQFLELNLGRIDIYQMRGFQMVSRSFPMTGTSILKINKGVPLPLHDKFMIFNPKVDIEMLDAHHIKTTSTKICQYAIYLLHYKYLGVDIMVKRAQQIKQRVPPNSFCKGINGNILQIYPSFVRTREEYKQEIDQMMREAARVI